MNKKFLLHLDVLSDRYWDTVFGDSITTLLLIGQAPLIGFLCTWVWGAIDHDTPSLYFVMSLACVWFGAINACREIVKERSILERERLFGLCIAAYVISKFKVLSLIGLLQCILLQMAIEWKISVHGHFLVQTISLWLATWCGVGLGLLVSALTNSQEKAVGSIPLLILPQILFSELTLEKEYYTTLIACMEKIMPVHWSYSIFKELAATDTSISHVTLYFFLMILMAAILLFSTWIALGVRKAF